MTETHQTRSLELASAPRQTTDRGAHVALHPEDLDAAERLAAVHREVAASLPVGSELRGLALRAGGHWARLAGLPRQSLSALTGSRAD